MLAELPSYPQNRKEAGGAAAPTTPPSYPQNRNADGTAAPAALVPQADTDIRLLDLWLHGRSTATQRAYRADAEAFLAWAAKPLRAVTLSDLQAYADQLAESQAPASQARRLAAVKSLCAFAHRVGYLPFDVGRPLRLPPRKATLAERILPESDVQRLLALEAHPRNRVLLRLLYAAGVRVSELCALCWRDVQPRDGGAGQITVYGKGAKTRAVLLSATTWRELAVLRGDAAPDAPVFRSRKGGALTAPQVWRIVRAAAERAGIAASVSPHWLRHAHASHALDRGAPIHLVSSTLGHADLRTTSAYTHARPGDSSARYLAV
jgi:integrase/recombinase XerD